MNIQLNFIQKCLFTMALLVPSLLYAQVTKECFKARIQTPVKERMNFHLTSSDTIPLKHLGTIYALSIDATIEQPREASYVRIVLEDTEGHNYLVAESDWFRNDTTTVQLSEYCEETAQLNGVTPLRLKCYLTNASLQLTGIHTSSEMPKRGMMTKAELESVKTSQVQDVVDRINEYNVRHGKLWQAGVTPFALRCMEQQGEVGEDDAYLVNMKYYVGGLYEIGERTQKSTTLYVSPYADSFDWSEERHGKCWITPVKNQISHGPCHIFAAVGVAESLTNLYFNDTINLDLSEEFVETFTNFDQTGHWSSYTLGTPIQFIATDSVIDEVSLPYGTPLPYSGPRPSGIESVRFHDVMEVSPFGKTFNSFCDSLKKHLINDGPGVWGCHFPSNTYPDYSNHYMALVGYGKTIYGTPYHIITASSNSYVTIDASMAGKTYWIFKNSYGDSQQHYMNIIINDDAYLYPAYFAKLPINRRGHHDSEIICQDLDGDGYYNWGISETPPISLPAWAFPERDADDKNRYIGSLDSFGHVTQVQESQDWWEISNTQYVNTPTFNRNQIDIKNGGNLIVTSDLRCFPGTYLVIESGGTLEIQGGSVHNVEFIIDPGGTLKITNGGELSPIIDDTHTFEVPQGAILQIDRGDIKKSAVVFPSSSELNYLCPCETE